MKDEAGGEIDEFVGLRAKLYAYQMLEGKESKKCKGVKKSVTNKSILHKDYKKCLFTKKPEFRSMNILRSRLHEIYFLSAVFSPLTSAEACEKGSWWLWKEKLC